MSSAESLTLHFIFLSKVVLILSIPKHPFYVQLPMLLVTSFISSSTLPVSLLLATPSLFVEINSVSFSLHVPNNRNIFFSLRPPTNDCYKVSPVTCCSTLRDKMQRIPTYKLNKLTLDPAYISVRAVCWNVFHTACLMACCFKATVDTIGSNLYDKEKLFDCIRHSSASVAAKTFRIRKKNGKY